MIDSVFFVSAIVTVIQADETEKIPSKVSNGECANKLMNSAVDKPEG